MLYEINSLSHSGIRGMRWGRRRYQNEDGSLTPIGRQHYGVGSLRKRSQIEELKRVTKQANAIERQYGREAANEYMRINDPTANRSSHYANLANDIFRQSGYGSDQYITGYDNKIDRKQYKQEQKMKRRERLKDQIFTYATDAALNAASNIANQKLNDFLDGRRMSNEYRSLIDDMVVAAKKNDRGNYIDRYKDIVNREYNPMMNELQGRHGLDRNTADRWTRSVLSSVGDKPYGGTGGRMRGMNLDILGDRAKTHDAKIEDKLQKSREKALRKAERNNPYRKMERYEERMNKRNQKAVEKARKTITGPAQLPPSYKTLYTRLKASGRLTSFNQFMDEVYYPDLERRR